MQPWLIIDGYNLIHRLAADEAQLPADLEGRRQFLLRLLDSLAGELAEKITVVFDGAQRPAKAAAPAAEAPAAADVIEVVFSPPDKTADTVIEQLVCGAQRPGEICVVTSDRSELDNVLAGGAEAISCAEFLLQTRLARERLGWLVKHRAAKAKGFALGESFPSDR